MSLVHQPLLPVTPGRLQHKRLSPVRRRGRPLRLRQKLKTATKVARGRDRITIYECINIIIIIIVIIIIGLCAVY